MRADAWRDALPGQPALAQLLEWYGEHGPEGRGLLLTLVAHELADVVLGARRQALAEVAEHVERLKEESKV